MEALIWFTVQTFFTPAVTIAGGIFALGICMVLMDTLLAMIVFRKHR